jgi:CheY-like chemotaxis protein
MDMQMPEVNGLEATRTIKEIRPQLPVIATTANTFGEDELAFKEAGCDAFLSKPLQFRQLFELMQSFFAQQK